MPKEPVAVIVSDLHMGSGDSLDDFRSPGGPFRAERFLAFCREIARVTMDRRLTFILNGDVLDLWEIADEDELDPATSDAIIRKLSFPALDDAAREKARAYSIGQLQKAFDKHRAFVEGIATILDRADARIVYLIGNHDHAMQIDAVQNQFRNAFARRPAATSLSDRITFSFFHSDAQLKLYVEHGNQVKHDESFFDKLDNGFIQSSGYAAIRFIWNRFQAKFRPPKARTSEALSLVVNTLLDQTKANRIQILQWFADYFRVCEERHLEVVRGYGIGILYRLWKASKGRDSVEERFVNAVELALEGYVPDPVDPSSVLEPSVPFVSKYEVDWPGSDVHVDEQSDVYSQTLRDAYNTVRVGFPKLDREIHVRLFLGHTHDGRNQRLDRYWPGQFQYVNTASWNVDNKKPCYGFVEGSNVDRPAGLRELEE